MNKTRERNYNLAILGLLTAIMLIMAMTPLGTIPLGVISITIAHIPILLATLMLGLKEGLIMALIFGSLSMLKAITAPEGLLDPLFQNPLISIAPRMMIPITTYYTSKLFSKTSKYISTTVSVIVGNLTNTFFVYLSMYLFVRDKFEALSGKSALATIISLVSTSTLIKTVIVVIITVPIVLRVKVNRKTN